MNCEVALALIEAGGVVLASVIGVSGVFWILRHRKKVVRLADEVDAYYHHEGQLAAEIYRLRNLGCALDEKKMPALRRRFRDEFAKGYRRPSMTARRANELRSWLL